MAILTQKEELQKQLVITTARKLMDKLQFEISQSRLEKVEADLQEKINQAE